MGLDAQTDNAVHNDTPTTSLTSASSPISEHTMYTHLRASERAVCRGCAHTGGLHVLKGEASHFCLLLSCPHPRPALTTLTTPTPTHTPQMPPASHPYPHEHRPCTTPWRRWRRWQQQAASRAAHTVVGWAIALQTAPSCAARAKHRSAAKRTTLVLAALVAKCNCLCQAGVTNTQQV